jgi:lipopolysaccharide export system permease protein
LVAVPLSRLRPRQGRYSRVWLAIVVYFAYSNLVSAGKVWLARGTIPEFLGLWWTHVAIALLAFGFISGPRLVANMRLRRRS